MKCPKCGAEVQPSEVFCGECGARMAPAVEKKGGLPIVPIVIGVIIVVALCCLVGIILALVGVIALPGLTPATPTPTPTNTPTPTASPTSTPPATPTNTPTPVQPTKTVALTPTEPPAVGGMKTYSSSEHGFSIQYPADWIMKEGSTGPMFTGTRELAGANVGAIKGAGTLGDEKYLTDLFVAMFKGMFDDMKIVSEDTRTFNGVTWRYVVITGSYGGMAIKADMYTTIHTSGTGYVFMGFAGTLNYDKQTHTFASMMESFKFLP